MKDFKINQIMLLSMFLFAFQALSFSQWEEVGSPKDEDGKNLPIYDLLNLGNKIYAATGSGVWESVDNGMQWEYSGLEVVIGGRSYPVTDLLFHAGILYASVDQVYRMSSEGNWEQIGGTIDYGCSNPKMTIEAFKGHLFANIPQCTGKGLYRLTGMTGNWSKEADAGNLVIWSDGEILFAGRKYTTDGENWSSVSGVKGSGAIYTYAVTNGRYYLGAYSIGSTDPIYVSEDGKNFSSFSDGLWKNTTGSSIISYGDTVFSFTLERDYLQNKTNHVKWADGESTSWNKLGGPIYMSYDLSSFMLHKGHLYVASNGVEFKQTGSLGAEKIGGYGLWRFRLDESSNNLLPEAVISSKIHLLRAEFDQSGQYFRLITDQRAAYLPELSLSLYSGKGRRISQNRIETWQGTTEWVKIPRQAGGVAYYNLVGDGLQQSGPLVFR